MSNREFHISDILTVTTGLLVSSRRMDGVYDLLNYMTRDDLFTHQLPRAGRECEPHLKRQFPQFTTAEFDAEVGELNRALEQPEADAEKVVDDWVARMAAKYGDSFPVERVPGDDHSHQHPLAELMNMVGEDRVIVVNTEQEGQAA